MDLHAVPVSRKVIVVPVITTVVKFVLPVRVKPTVLLVIMRGEVVPVYRKALTLIVIATDVRYVLPVNELYVPMVKGIVSVSLLGKMALVANLLA